MKIKAIFNFFSPSSKLSEEKSLHLGKVYESLDIANNYLAVKETTLLTSPSELEWIACKKGDYQDFSKNILSNVITTYNSLASIQQSTSSLLKVDYKEKQKMVKVIDIYAEHHIISKEDLEWSKDTLKKYKDEKQYFETEFNNIHGILHNQNYLNVKKLTNAINYLTRNNLGTKSEQENIQKETSKLSTLNHNFKADILNKVEFIHYLKSLENRLNLFTSQNLDHKKTMKP